MKRKLLELIGIYSICVWIHNRRERRREIFEQLTAGRVIELINIFLDSAASSANAWDEELGYRLNKMKENLNDTWKKYNIGNDIVDEETNPIGF